MSSRHLVQHVVAWCALLALAAPGLLVAQRATFPARPSPGVYHVDEARLLGAGEAAEIDRIAHGLVEERGVPILVVTLPTLASRGAAGYTIERYARELFDRWGIGAADGSHGMLLLVSPGDRSARIELGTAWGRAYDDQAAWVMNELIVPELRDGRQAEGVLAGVRGLDAMARGLPLPSARQPRWLIPLVVGVFVGVALLAFSLFRSGRHGWAWAVIAAFAALLWLLSRAAARAGASADRSGGRGGGTFGGGSSGGGGATGRW